MENGQTQILRLLLHLLFQKETPERGGGIIPYRLIPTTRIWPCKEVPVTGRVCSRPGIYGRSEGFQLGHIKGDLVLKE
jgi:hypothetical protein